MHIVPSVASADPLRIAEQIGQLGPGSPLHLDIEDGCFIPNITFGLKTIRAVAQIATGPLDAHLMTMRPEDWLVDLQRCGVTQVCGHIEALPYPKQFLRHAQALGMKAGLALNCKTHLAELLPFLDCMDYLLVMTSEADYGDQSFFPSSLQRVQEARALVGPDLPIWVDGGISEDRLTALETCGATTAVMGRAIFARIGRPQGVS